MRSGEMHKSNAPATVGVAGVTSVNTRVGVVTLVPSDVGITAAVDKGVLYMDGATYANSAVLTWDKTTKTLTVGATGIINAPTINASVLMTTPEIDIGASAFPFLESSPGVLQVGSPSLVIDGNDVRIGDNLGLGNYPAGYVFPFTDSVNLGDGGFIVWDDGTFTGSITAGINVSAFSPNAILLVGSSGGTNNVADIGSTTDPARTGYFGTSVLGPLFGEVAASGTDTAGTNVVVAGGQGTGTGAGGTLKLQTAPAGSTGSTPNALVDGITIAADGTVTIPALAGIGSRAVFASATGVLSAP